MKRIFALLIVMGMLGLGSCSGPAESVSPEQIKVALGMASLNHPVHRVVQLGFARGAEAAGVQGSIAGLDEGSAKELQAKFEEAITQNGAMGILLWASDDTFYQFMRNMVQEHGTVFVVPHFAHEYVDTKDFIAANLYTPMEDIGTAAADALVAALHEAGITAGSIGYTQVGVDTTDNSAMDAFARRMAEVAPQFTVLAPVFEGLELSESSEKIRSLIENHPDMVGAFGSASGSAQSWTAARENTGREDIIVVGVDYTEYNLDLVEQEKVAALIGHHTYEEGYDGAGLLADLIGGQKIETEQDWQKIYDPIVITSKQNYQICREWIDGIVSGHTE